MADDNLKDFSFIQEKMSAEQIIKNPLLIRLYSNSFILGRTQGDLFFVTINNGVPQAIVNMNFMAAKKLLTVLSKHIQEIEHAVGEIKEVPSRKTTEHEK